MAMEYPLLSIIIPAYNVEDEISKCLNSILHQSYSNIEVIIVDDGSTDKTSILCDEYALKDSRIRVFHNSNGGMSAARNYALDRMTGSYLTFVDSDDWLENDILNIGMQYLIDNPSVDALRFGHTNYWSDQEKTIVPATEFHLSRPNDIYREYALKLQINQYPWGKFFKRSVFENVRFPIGKYYEDVPTIFRALKNIKVFDGLSISGYAYRRYRVGSVTRTMDDRIFDLHKNIEDLYHEAFETNPTLITYINTMQVMHLRVNMVAAWEDKGKRKDWFRKFRPFIKEARKYPYIWGNKTERIHWGLFLKFPRLYLDLWSYYQSRK